MKPIHEFGKEAAMQEKLRKDKMNRRKKWIIRVGLVVAVGAVILLSWGNFSGVLASSSETKTKKEKKLKDQQPTTPGVSISARWDLPQVLLEISGLAYLDQDRFACVQDESGTIFIYNTATKKIEKEISFGPAGDYEGLTVTGPDAWVVRADGQLISVAGFESGKPVVTNYDTHLTIDQNVEGLCYDKANNRLLVAIKDNEPGNVNYKGIYAFDLAARKMPAQPVYKLEMDDPVFAGVARKKSAAIMPSAIAIHPVTNDIYITDGRNSRLLILGSSGKSKKLFNLDAGEFAQPEGISFSPAGDLFISNEGKKKPGNILQVSVSGF
jgi:DNA-binding beta-propeller fold protein YncE